MRLESKQQTRAVLPGDHPPRKASEGTFKCPQEIQADVGGLALGQGIGGNGAEAPKLCY
jgi:hypothetical protein